MEEQLNTRSILTGWVFLIAFLAGYLFHRSHVQILSEIEQNYATLVVALLASPFVGWGVGAVVIVYLYRRYGHPYHGESRERIREWARMRIPQGTEEGNRRQTMLNQVQGNVFFAYAMNMKTPTGLIEWGRRQHTARFLGYNWPVATALGLAAGLLVGFPYGWRCGWTEILLATVVILAALAVWFNGRQADDEIERVERLWLEDFIAEQNEDRNEPAQDNDRQVLFRREALQQWADSL